MNERDIKQILGWFDRARPEEDAELAPVPVTRARAAMAHDFLRRHSGIDFDEFHEAAMAEALSDEPLGKTPDCLTPVELSRAIQSHAHRLSSLPEVSLVTRVMTHVAQCGDCWNTVEEYQECEIDSFMNGVAPDPKAMANAMWIAPVGALQTQGVSDPCLNIGVVTRETHQGRIHDFGSMRLRLTCPFESPEIPMTPVAELPQPSWPLMERIAGRSMDDGFVMCSFKTDSIYSLRETASGDLGYVTVSRGVGKRAVHATRIIRFSEDFESP